MRSGHVEEVQKAVRNHFSARGGPDLIARISFERIHWVTAGQSR